jgi:hypothetical protein
MGEVVKRGEPTVKRVEEVNQITDVILEPTVGSDGSLRVSVTGVAESSLVDKTSVTETKMEKRTYVGIFPGFVPFTKIFSWQEANRPPTWFYYMVQSIAYCVVTVPMCNALTLGVPTAVSLVYDPLVGEYVLLDEKACKIRTKWGLRQRTGFWGIVGTYKYLDDPIVRNDELPPVVVQKGISKRVALSGLEVGSAVSSLSFNETQLSGADGQVTFAVRSGGSHYVDVELSLKDVTASPYAKLLEAAVGSKTQKFRMQLSRTGSVPLKVPDWPLESIAVIGSVPDAALAAKINDALADIRFFNLPDTPEMEMALQERLIDRTKLFDDSALMQRVCQMAKSDLLIVLKPTGGAVERTIVAKLVRVKTGEIIASAEANGAEDVRVVAEVLCRAYAAAKKQGDS